MLCVALCVLCGMCYVVCFDMCGVWSVVMWCVVCVVCVVLCVVCDAWFGMVAARAGLIDKVRDRTEKYVTRL